MQKYSKSIVVLGSGGNIGKKVIELLDVEKFNIIKTTRNLKNVTENLIFADVTDIASIEKAVKKADLIINCTGPSYLYKDNVLQAAQAMNKNYIDAFGGHILQDRLKSDQDSISIINAGCEPGVSGLVTKYISKYSGENSIIKTYAGGRSDGGQSAFQDIILSSVMGYGKNNSSIYERKVIKNKPDCNENCMLINGIGEAIYARSCLTKEMELLSLKYNIPALCSYRIFPDREMENLISEGCIEVIKEGSYKNIESISYAIGKKISCMNYGKGTWFAVHAENQINGITKNHVTLNCEDSSLLTAALISLITVKVMKDEIKQGGYWAFEVIDFPELLEYLSDKKVPVNITLSEEKEQRGNGKRREN